MKSAIMSTPHKSAASRSSVPPPVGDGKRRTASRVGGGHKFACSPWAAMASLCEEDEELALAPVSACVAVAVALPARIDAFEALSNTECQWGDLAVFGTFDAPAPARRGYVQRDDGTWRDLDAPCLTLADLFAQPFATRLGQEDEEDYIYLNTEDLTEPEFEAMMRWLYFEGWDVPCDVTNCGQTVEVIPGTQKPRLWAWPEEEVEAAPSAFRLAVEAAAARGPSRFMLAAAGGAEAPAPSGGAGGSKPPKPAAAAKPRVVIPRFCKHAEGCPDKATTCNYVHGDTIQCVDKACGFDKPAEGKCCSGDKRKTCIFMHASEGQTWSPEQVVHRPSA